MITDPPFLPESPGGNCKVFERLKWLNNLRLIVKINYSKKGNPCKE